MRIIYAHGHVRASHITIRSIRPTQGGPGTPLRGSPNGWFEIKGKPAEARVNPQALGTEFGKELWALSESMTGIRYLSNDHTS
ncbi:Hypothetical protein HDN1F_31160 [gamma proteobacterium HdN1]|nr:Hypothetical protein HDN1F_31160 [gamma proteobacterium HdN1]